MTEQLHMKNKYLKALKVFKKKSIIKILLLLIINRYNVYVTEV